MCAEARLADRSTTFGGILTDDGPAALRWEELSSVRVLRRELLLGETRCLDPGPKIKLYARTIPLMPAFRALLLPVCFMMAIVRTIGLQAVEPIVVMASFNMTAA